MSELEPLLAEPLLRAASATRCAGKLLILFSLAVDLGFILFRSTVPYARGHDAQQLLSLVWSKIYGNDDDGQFTTVTTTTTSSSRNRDGRVCDDRSRERRGLSRETSRARHYDDDRSRYRVRSRGPSRVRDRSRPRSRSRDRSRGRSRSRLRLREQMEQMIRKQEKEAKEREEIIAAAEDDPKPSNFWGRGYANRCYDGVGHFDGRIAGGTESGRVIAYFTTQGFGFIKPDNELKNDIFFHRNSALELPIVEGDRVRYTPWYNNETADHRAKPKARDIFKFKVRLNRAGIDEDETKPAKGEKPRYYEQIDADLYRWN